MHEFSLAEAVVEQVRRHAPPRQPVRSATLRVGPLQMIEPEAMQMAWHALTSGTGLDGCELVLNELPPQRTCPDCGRSWTGGQLVEPCTCGCIRPEWTEGDVLRLESLEVDDEVTV